MSVSENRGTPKWMVKIMENPMDDLGVPPFSETLIYRDFYESIISKIPMNQRVYWNVTNKFEH